MSRTTTRRLLFLRGPRCRRRNRAISILLLKLLGLTLGTTEEVLDGVVGRAFAEDLGHLGAVDLYNTNEP
jgi:hypothetical protein